MQLRRRELLGLVGLALVGCESDNRSERGASGGTRLPTSQTLDARRQTQEETTVASTTEASTTTVEPLTTTTIPVKVIEVIGRKGWGAAEAGPGLVEHRIERLTIHHTAVELEDNRQAPSRLRAHQEFHQKDRGWPDLAYHFAVDRDGNIYEGRSTDFRGDTATSYDPTGHFLVVLEGNFDVEVPADPQVESLTDLLAWAADRYSVGVDTIKSHRDYAPGETSCPGANLYALLQSNALLEMVDGILNRGPPNLSYLHGAEAIARVETVAQGR